MVHPVTQRPRTCRAPGTQSSIACGCENAPVATTADLVIDGRTVDPSRLAEICRRYGVAELAVFGSVARGDASGTSDVDVLYVLGPGAALGFALNDLEDELAALFGRPVDLVSKRALHRLIRDQVLAEARTLYAA
jgi:predicted nucleotidyltransferase